MNCRPTKRKMQQQSSGSVPHPAAAPASTPALLVRVRYNGLIFLVATHAGATTDEVVATALDTYCTRLSVTGADAEVGRRGLLLRLADGTLCPAGTPMALLLGTQASSEVYSLAAAHAQTHHDGWVRLNVGGQLFHTARSTLCGPAAAGSMLERMFGEWPDSHTDASGAFLLDLEPRYFAPILHYLRTGALALDAGVSREGVLDCARFLQVSEVVRQLQAPVGPPQPPPRPNYRILLLACRLASWIGLSGAVPKAVPAKFKFSNTRKYGNQYELFSHSNELVALILNDLARLGWFVISGSAGGAGAELSVYQSFLLASTNDDDGAILVDESALKGP